MQETLITFETAKLAKEKGFDIGVNQSYIIYKESYNYDDDPNHRESYKVNDIEINSHYHVNNHKGIDLSNELYEAYSVPTQSLLQKWLREVHNIHLAVEPETFNPETDYISEIIILPRKFLKYRGKTYEEALEIALKCGLKLVEDELV